MTDNKPTGLCRIIDVANNAEEICFWSFLGIASLIFLFSTYRLIILIKRRFAQDVKIITILLLAWSLSISLNCLFNNLTYRQIRSLDDQGTQEQDYPWSVSLLFPKLTYLTDPGSAILLHTVLLIVPYCWIKNIIYFLEQTNSGSQDLGYVRFFNRFIKIYIIVSRIIYFGLWISAAFLQGSIFFTFATIIKSIIVAESFIIMFIMGYSCYALLKYFHGLDAITEESDESKMKCQTALLIICCFVRCLIDVVSLLPPLMEDLRKYKSPCLEEQNNYNYCILLIIVFALMNFGPAIIVLILYTPPVIDDDSSRRSLTRSMLSSSMIDSNSAV